MGKRTLPLFVVIFAAAGASFGASSASANSPFTYVGPNPYTSAADSPFVTGNFGFCVEDFEDGTLDVPAVTGNGSPVGPGGLIDSVDGDDGAIDGSGTNGHSYFSGDGSGGITFTFTEGRANGYPTEVGLVWTDGGFGATVSFEAFGPTGVSFGVFGPFSHADSSNNGQTAEDRVYGVASPDGISKVTLRNATGGGGIEIDHLQLNACIVCGDANVDTHVSASDALIALRTSVGTESCPQCRCDTNNSGSNTASDALAILKKSVGLTPAMNCPDCLL